ncbi:MAG: protein-disulfide reductase DsbD family protein [Arachidicoccus sp.]|nr:protein-disulfide reductase DsbD family protein [Arachidicoccus sp.]
MKKLISVLACTIFATLAFAQENPVSWATKAVKQADNSYKVIITATFSSPWHIYSQTTPDGGPVATKFTFTKNPLVTLVGKTEEKGNLLTTHDKNFGVDVKYYANKVDFIQIVKVRGKVKTNVSGTVNYMVCNDHECMPPVDKSFSVAL